MTRQDSPTIALVLGNGAARGWSHIGVIHELASMRASSGRCKPLWGHKAAILEGPPNLVALH